MNCECQYHKLFFDKFLKLILSQMYILCDFMKKEVKENEWIVAIAKNKK